MKIKTAAGVVLGVVLSCVGSLWAQEEVNLTQHTAKHQRVLARAHLLHHDSLQAFGKEYLGWEEEVTKHLGLQVGADISYLLQRGAPSGKQTSIQGYYYPYVTWDLFTDTRFGSGQINFNYTYIHYWGIQGTTLQNRLGLLSAQNDYTANQEIFSQFSYTHTLPGKMDWLSFTIGQFPLYNFDGSNYLDNQQTALFNYALSQNGTSVYPIASFGGYVQAAPGSWTLAAGWQDASNIDGQTIQLNHAFGGYYTWFGSISYSPTIKGLGAGQYSFLYYYQPSVADQPGIGRGWSFNASQNFGKKWAVSARANGSDGNINTIKNSYALALSYLNPLERNDLDVITLGAVYNRADGEALGYPASWRSGETALELQWVWGIGKMLTITPDVQIYPRAALGSGDHVVTVAGLRTTIML